MVNRKAKVIAPTAVTDLKSYDEANVARLGLISIQERIPENYTSWENNFMRDGRPSRLSCVASVEYGGVPHGLDGDLSTALIDLYIEQGSPPSGEVRTTAYRLLQRAGFPDTGYYYAVLKRSLVRLRFAGYTASESWRDAARERWTSVTFTYLVGLIFESEDRELGLNEGSSLMVTLADPIVRSIRASYLKPLNLVFMRSLTRSLTRSLYRLLDAKRYSPTDLSTPQREFRVNLIHWAQECKIVDKTPDRVRRTLQGAHDELIERGYLEAVRTEGRGKQATLTYVFAGAVAALPLPLDVEDTVAVGALLAQGVSRPVAVRLAGEFGQDRILERVRKAQAIRQGGFSPKRFSAFLVDVVRDDGQKYPDPPGYGPPHNAATRSGSARPQVIDEPTEQRLIPLTPQEQVEATIEGLKIFLRKRLNAEQWSALRAHLSEPERDPATFARAFIERVYGGEQEQAVTDLIALL